MAAADALAGAADEVTDLVVREVGKPLTEAAAETGRGIGILHATTPSRPSTPWPRPCPAPARRPCCSARQRPRGVAGLVTPWNFPVAIPLWKAAPALAFGNAVALEAVAGGDRESRCAWPSCSARPCPRACSRSCRAGPTPRTAMLEGGGLHLVHRLGGRRPPGRGGGRRARHPSQAEMGGLNASVGARDADPSGWPGWSPGRPWATAGQKCTATSRAIVVGDPRPFTEALVAAVEGLAVGDPAEEATMVGPVIARPARRRVVEAAEEAAAGGAGC